MNRIAAIILLLLITACNNRVSAQKKPHLKTFKSQRLVMVQTIKSYGIKDRAVLDAMIKIPRHIFIPDKYRSKCNPYGDHPCPIGYGQTISQPFIVAFMTSAVFLKKGEKILEIGTGSGYQTAVLASLEMKVYSIEIIPQLYQHAKTALKKMGYKNVSLLRGDGYKGWKKHSPFDAVIVTCAPEKIPVPLIKQLRPGGRMIIPVGKYRQKLIILRKVHGRLITKKIMDVRFVPMVHEK